MPQLSLSDLLAQGPGAQPQAQPVAQPQTEEVIPEILVTPEGGPSPTVTMRRSGDLADMHRILMGIRAAESGGKDDAVGPPVSAAKGGRAYGAYGMQEGTARDMGAKDDGWKTNEPEARVLAEKYYSQLYAKFGNHDDALRAYNWGPANVSRWAMGGKAPGGLPASVRGYGAKVMDIAGLDSPGRRMAEDRGKMNFSDLVAEGPKAEDNMPDTPEDWASASSWLEDTTQEVADYAGAFTAGAARGALELPAGAIRATVGAISPEAGQKINSQIEALDEKLDPIVQKHPYAAFAGNVVGSTATILAGGGLIGGAVKGLMEYRAIGEILAKIPEVARPYLAGAAGGAAVGAAPRATEREEENYDRTLGIALGAGAGTLGTWIGRSVAETQRAFADQGARDVVLGNIQEGMKELGGAATAVQQAVTAQAQRVQAAGQGTRGFAAQELDSAAQGATQVGAGTLAGAQGVATEARRASDIMGITDELARKKAWDESQAAYEKQMSAWNADFDSKYGGMAPSAQAQVRVVHEQTNPPPSPPPSYRPRPVSAENYAEGIAYLRREVSRAKGVKKERLQGLKKALEDEAGAQAAAARGFGPKGRFTKDEAIASFMREVRQRETLMKDVEPILDHFATRFGTTTPTGAQFYDWMMTAVEKGNTRELDGLGQILGSSDRMQKAAQKMLLNRMVQAGSPGHNPQKVLDWFNTNSPAMKHFLKPDLINELQGLAKIQARITERARYDATHKVTHSRWGLRGSSFLWYIGLEHAFRGVVTGAHHQIGEGAALVASGYFAHSLLPILQKAAGIRNLSPLLRQMAKMKPEGPAFDRMTEEVVRRAQSRYIGAAQTLQQGPPTEGGEGSWVGSMLQ